MGDPTKSGTSFLKNVLNSLFQCSFSSMLQVDVLLGNLQTASDSVRFQNMVEIVDLRWVTLYNSCVIE